MCVTFVSFSKICNLWGRVFSFQTNVYFIHIFGFFFLTRIPPYYVNSRAHKAWIPFCLETFSLEHKYTESCLLSSERWNWGGLRGKDTGTALERRRHLLERESLAQFSGPHSWTLVVHLKNRFQDGGKAEPFQTSHRLPGVWELRRWLCVSACEVRSLSLPSCSPGSLRADWTRERGDLGRRGSRVCPATLRAGG